MGRVLRFSARAQRSEPNAEGRGTPARVLLFTGVRYEREPVAVENKQEPRRKRARKSQAER